VIGPVGVGYVAGEVAGVPEEIGEVADAGMVISDIMLVICLINYNV
jgi:hypothetical protein